MKLEFNQNHKVADISSIIPKLFKTGGKVLLCEILISSVLLLSGCGAIKEKLTNDNLTPVATAIIMTNDNLTPVATAIIMTNDNALLMDLSWYDNDYSYGTSVAFVADMDGNRYIIGHEDAIIVLGENSHERAEQMAEILVGLKGEVSSYDEMQNHGKSK